MAALGLFLTFEQPSQSGQELSFATLDVIPERSLLLSKNAQHFLAGQGIVTTDGSCYPALSQASLNTVGHIRLKSARAPPASVNASYARDII